MKKSKTTCLYFLLLLSTHLMAQSPGGILPPAVWLKGNFSADPGRLASLNYNPAMALDSGDISIKMPGNMETLRGVTIFTVYKDSLADKEKQVWEMTGEFGDLSLTTNHVASESKSTNVNFEKSKPNAAGTKAEAIIHSYSSHDAMGSASREYQYKGSLIRFGNPTSVKSSDSSPKSVAEFILYKKVLNDKETNKIESFLALKYGVTLKENYLNAAGKTVWNISSDSRFSNNIAGIARNDESALLQKQSISCTSVEQLVIGVKKIVESNGENTGELNDGDYLIWGDNGEKFVTPKGLAIGNEILLAEKKWLMKPSGKSSNKISTELKISTLAFLPGKFPEKNFYLVINRPASADFSPENCTYINPETIENGIATFTNIFWDTDGSGRDKFTFGFKPELLPLQQSVSQSPVRKDPGLNRGGLISCQVFPNPVSDGNYKASIHLDKPTDIKINIFDLSQHLVLSKEESGQASYQFSGHIDGAPGAYVFQVITPDEVFYRMIILQ